MSNKTESPVFDYRLLRLVIGVIAFALPIIVLIAAGDVRLTSISASYYTDARNYFVGLLFVVAAFLLAYNGHLFSEALASKFASAAAVGVALFPTLCGNEASLNKYIECATQNTATMHYVSAATMFGVLAYFCLGPFRDKTKTHGPMFARRRKIYWLCGWSIILSFVIGIVASWLFKDNLSEENAILLYAETAALWAFGIAWIVSGKTFAFIADEDERYRFKE
jgi:hypothetical protein